MRKMSLSALDIESIVLLIVSFVVKSHESLAPADCPNPPVTTFVGSVLPLVHGTVAVVINDYALAGD